jgi:hypothetical protein
MLDQCFDPRVNLGSILGQIEGGSQGGRVWPQMAKNFADFGQGESRMNLDGDGFWGGDFLHKITKDTAEGGDEGGGEFNGGWGHEQEASVPGLKSSTPSSQFSSGSLFDDFAFIFGETVELVNEAVDLRIDGGNLAHNRSLLLRGSGDRLLPVQFQHSLRKIDNLILDTFVFWINQSDWKSAAVFDKHFLESHFEFIQEFFPMVKSQETTVEKRQKIFARPPFFWD